MKLVGDNIDFSGIYYIINVITKKIYVGSAVSFRNRFKSHKSLLNRNLHYNKKLQNSWNKYGCECFEFRIIEIVDNKASLIEREQYHIDLNEATKKGYNVSPFAGSTLGVPCKEETKKLFREKSGEKAYWYGKGFTDEHRQNIARRGERNHYFGKHLSKEHKCKIGLAQQGEKGNNAKLTETDVIEIRLKYKTGLYTHQHLADEYGVGRKAITKIINRQRWKHI